MKQLNIQARESEKGFTLVELAIVMIIIGVLLGGVLKGQEMITNARISSTAKEMESLQAAYNSFVDRFNIEPGDMNNPGARIANCGAVCSLAGNNDGEISIPVGSAPGVAAGTRESVGFFGQLLDAGFISGMTGDNAGAVAVGVTNPTGPVPGSAYKVGDNRATGAATGFVAAQLTNRPYIILDNGVPASGVATGAVTPQQAATIDTKLDDGNPQTGYVVGVRGTATTGCSNAAATNYNEAVANAQCSIAYRL